MGKAVVYKPISKTPPGVVEEKIKPLFEESGVKYQGSYIIRRGSEDFETRSQSRKIYGEKITQGTITSPYTITRTPGTNFYCTKIVFEHDTPFSYLDIYDDVYNTNNAKLYHKTTAVNGTFETRNYDFLTPLEFQGDIQLYQIGVWGVNNFLTITFYGWEEPK